ncbi:MAG: hypothetical protein CMM18_04500 [Rhodospirillaceae bacterium]|nr:hypothetical protein [Rhodospirillaceae bacterium]|tara:strand:- start:1175 stop:1489 length:315 start_codon:yes stop_codon:yes gene_type:complete
MSNKLKIFTLVVLLCIASGCSSKMSVIPRAFGQGPNPSEICISQGISENNPQFSKCINFYKSQNSLNRNTMVIGTTITILGALFFERECDCLFGPDRGEKFKPE